MRSHESRERRDKRYAIGDRPRFATIQHMPASYLVFARKEYQQPLEWIGRVTVEAAPAPEGAVQAEVGRQAREQFGESGWVEMVAVPETAIRRVIPMD